MLRQTHTAQILNKLASSLPTVTLHIDGVDIGSISFRLSHIPRNIQTTGRIIFPLIATFVTPLASAAKLEDDKDDTITYVHPHTGSKYALVTSNLYSSNTIPSRILGGACGNVTELHGQNFAGYNYITEWGERMGRSFFAGLLREAKDPMNAAFENCTTVLISDLYDKEYKKQHDFSPLIVIASVMGGVLVICILCAGGMCLFTHKDQIKQFFLDRLPSNSPTTRSPLLANSALRSNGTFVDMHEIELNDTPQGRKNGK